MNEDEAREVAFDLKREQIKREHLTVKVELSYKEGVLKAATVIDPFLDRAAQQVLKQK